MSHQDVRTLPADPEGTPPVARWMLTLIHGSIIDQFAFRKTACWTPRQFVTTAVLWGLGEASTLSERFAIASQTACRLFPHSHRLGASYQAFLKLLIRWSGVIIVLLMQECRRRMILLEGFVDSHGFVLFGVDGTRIALPRTAANEQAFAAGLNPACRRRGKRRHTARQQAEIPSVWLTMIWHLGCGLPWLWRLGKANASERDHLRNMVSTLPEHSLLVADAGYAGYEYWKQLLEAGVHFIIRVGSGISLLQELGAWERYDDRVWLWPDYAARRCSPPLKLRLVRIQHEKQSVWLVTSVLSQQRLSAVAISRIYRQRWGVEVFFRDFKQTFARRKLQSRTPAPALVELHWSLVGLTLAMLQARLEQQRHAQQPVRPSVAGVLRVVRRAVRWCYHSVAEITSALAAAVIDGYQRRTKSRRIYPRKRDYNPPGPPKLIVASTRLNTLAQNVIPLTLTSYG